MMTLPLEIDWTPDLFGGSAVRGLVAYQNLAGGIDFSFDLKVGCAFHWVTGHIRQDVLDMTRNPSDEVADAIRRAADQKRAELVGSFG